MIHNIHKLNKLDTISIMSNALTPNGIDILEELIAEDGYKLTQSEEVPIKERIIASAVMLGTGHSSSEWKEITIEEANQIIKEQEEIREKEVQIDTTCVR